MPIIVSCPSCGSRLKAPDSHAGRKVKCGRCSSVLTVDAAEAPAAVPEPAAEPARRKTRATPEPAQRRQPEPEQPEDTEPPREGARRKKKRKKKRPKEPAVAGGSGWLWWAGGLAGFVAVALVVALLAIRAGHKDAVIACGLSLVIMVPISTVILIFSMIVSSHFAGGIDFGEIHVVIPKALALLLVIGLVVSLVPFGVYLTFPIWLFGLMYLFHLDLWESRFLVSINWLLNFVVKMFLLAVLLSGLMHGNPEADEEDHAPQKAIPGQQEEDPEAIDDLGGGFQQANEDDPNSPVVRIVLTGRPVTDAELAHLKGFTKLQVLELGSTQITDAGVAHLRGMTALRTLDLSRTRVSDAGLAHLEGLSQLKTLNLTGTKVTPKGIARLQKVLPRLKITR